MYERPLSLSQIALLTSLVFAGCSDDALGATEQNASIHPFEEVWRAGLTDYVGTPEVQPVEVTSGWLSRIDVHRFDPDPAAGGPICMRGGDFFVETRDGRGWGRRDLMIFLEAGGVCLDEICAQTSETALNLRLLSEWGDLVGIGGILDGDPLSINPLRNADLVHAPYCDGSLFSGNVDRILSDGDPSNGTQDVAYQRGLVNLTATFEVALSRYPDPRRIILAGTSGGSLGTLVGTVLARYYYPDKEIVVIADSGAPVLRGHDPDFAVRSLSQLDAYRFVPASCTDCMANGHATDMIAWALERDGDLRFGFMAHAHDRAIGQFYMQNTPEQYEAAWIAETNRLIAEFPDRVNRFIGPGQRHTYMLDVETAAWDITQQFLLYLTGPLILDGEDVSAEELGHWTLGGMEETSIREDTGREVSGYDWLAAYLRGGRGAFNALQTE